MNWIDRTTASVAPRWTLRRLRARAAIDVLARHFEAASVGRRTQGWNRSSADANAANMTGLTRIRDTARDLIRNNPYAESALSTICDHAVGWGITATTTNAGALRTWKSWADTPACDADNRLDFGGLEKLVMRTVAESGEALVRRRWRRPEDNLPLPMQLQVLEPDYLDLTRDGITTPSGGQIVQGVQFDPIGRREGYWLFPEHPGARSAAMTYGASRFVPAAEILHVFKAARPGQVRGMSWFAPVMLRLKDWDDYEDAALMKQKIAACLAVITSDVDGTAPALGTIADPMQPQIDTLEPGMIANIAPGRSISVVQPPTISEHADYAQTVLRAIAAGLGVTYEDLCGDYSQMPFSAARMSRLRHWARVEDWRWRMLIPQFCDPVWQWAMQAAAIVNLPTSDTVRWTAPPAPMIEPQAEGLAYMRLVRIGAITWPEMVRERGYDPDTVLKEIADWNKNCDALGVILDCDARRVSQQGQEQKDYSAATPSAPFAPTPAAVAPAPKSPSGSASNGTGRHAEAWAADTVEGAVALAREALAIAAHRLASETTPAPTVMFADGAIQTHVAAPTAAAAPNVTVEGATVNVAPPAVTIAEGAVRLDAPISVDARMTIPDGAIQISSPVMTIAEGAIKAEITTPPVTVDARTTLAEGAIRVETPIEAGAIQVDARTTVSDGAIHVDSPVVTIAEGAIRVDAPASPVTIEAGAIQVDARTTVDSPVMIAEGAMRTELPITIADTVNVPAGEVEVIRDERGRIARLKREGIAGAVVVNLDQSRTPDPAAESSPPAPDPDPAEPSA